MGSAGGTARRDSRPTARAADPVEHGRRSVVPKQVRTAAGRSLWPAAIWTGLGAAIVCATLAITIVATCWLPVSGTGGRTNSAIRAGLLSFLAAVHAGITVDGVRATWLPLGMLVVVGVTAWRAGSGLADVADHAGETDPARLAAAGLAQLLSFTLGCLVAVPFATLGTSRAPLLGVGVAAAAVFTVTGGVAFVRSSALRDWCVRRVPAVAAFALRAGAVATLVYLGCGALLAAASLVLHHAQAERLSHSVGGGLGGIPVLLLGVLSAPNVAIAAASYLAGPGFALGSGTHVGLFGSAHGTLPAFPVLAAVPAGAPNPVAWGLAALTPLTAGLLVVRLAWRVPGWRSRLASTTAAALVAGAAMMVLGWQGGGAVGDGRLRTVGASPWQLGGAIGGAVLGVALVALGLAAVWQAVLRRRPDDDEEDEQSFFESLQTRRLVAVAGERRRKDAAEREHGDWPDRSAG